MERMLSLSPLLIICALVIQAIQGCYYVVEGETREKIVDTGASATLQITADKGTTLIWTHMDTEAVVGRCAVGDFLLLGDSEIYSSHVKNHTSGQNFTYTLSLTASTMTEGVYRVSISCSDANETANVYFTVVLNTTAPTPGVLELKDRTECCNASSVSPSCLPACKPSTLNFLKFNFEQCGTNVDVMGLRSCLLKERNHVRSCRRRGVKGDCLHLCYDSSAKLNASACVSSLDEIIQSYYEGQAHIPSPPRNVFVEIKNRTAVVVHWHIPIENVAYLTNYQVLYKLVDDADFNSKFVSATTLRHTIAVKMNKRYVVKIRACGPHGCSFPSTSMTASTVAEYFYPISGNKSSVATCCEREGVSKDCQLQLCIGIPRQIYISQIFDCIKDWPKIVKCFADGRDHTPCCMRNAVEAKCAKYCSGKEVDTKQSDLACMANFRVISSCFDAGVRTVPSPPRMLRTVFVLSTSIQLQWDPPKRIGNPKTELKYSVLYRNISAGDTRDTVITNVSSTKLSVGNLTEGVIYEMSVVAYNTHGTSLSSTILRIATHSVAPITFKAAAKYDPKQCCKNKGVATACVNTVCDLTSTATIPSSCRTNTTAIAHCIADGRNHTSCCRSDARIHPNCLFMCSLDVRSPSVISAGVVWGCLTTQTFSGLRSCYASGHGELPSPPRNLRLMTIQQELLQIMFDPPTSYKDVSGYRVYVTSNGKLEEIKREDSLTHTLMISGLKSNKEYEIRVTAVTKTGYESLPSNSLSARTLPTLPAKWYENKMPNFNRSGIINCCIKTGVSSQCQSLCNPSNTSTITWTAERARMCVTDLVNIIGCSVDKRDHTPCCQSRRVPDFCLPMCAGHVNSNITNSAVCIQFFPEIRSCFLEGYEVLPEAPHVEEIQASSHSSVDIKFSIPEKNKELPGKVFYYLYYRSTNNYWSVRPKIKSPYQLSRLTTSSTYRIFIVAVSDNGTSLPSAIYNVTTFPNSAFDVFIIASPGTLVKQHDLVKLTCTIAIPVSATYSWYHEGRERSSGGVLTMNVTRDDVGLYACVTEAIGKSVTRYIYLRVQYGIRIYPQQPVIRAELFSTVSLSCTMSGFPEYVEWLDNKGKSISTSSKLFSIQTKSNQHYTESQLVILKLTDMLYGTYQCVGSNNYGKVASKIYVTGDNDTSLIPTPSPPATVEDPKACCKKAGVSDGCLSSCDFKVPADFFKKNFNCIYEFSRIFQCLTDRRNHTQCCQRRNVPSHCWPVCSGQLPARVESTFQCFNPTYAQLTVECMKEGTAKIPTAPQHTKVSNPTTSSLDVSWIAPVENVEYLKNYEIRLIDLEKKVNGELFVDAKKNLKYTITRLPSGHTFQVSVRARSLYGDSHFSTQYRAYTLGIPKPPINLHAELIGGVSIKLSWEMPQFSAVKATSYSVHWATEEMESNGKVNRNSTSKRELVLPCLQPQTKYKFQVVAVNDIGESAKSQEEIKKTDKNANPTCTTKKKTVIKYTTDNRHVIIIVILLMFLIVGLGFAGLFVYTNRNNPRYVWPTWMRRIPGMQQTRQSVSTQDFDNPIRFSNLDIDDDDSRVSFGGPGARQRDFGGLSTEA